MPKNSAGRGLFAAIAIALSLLIGRNLYLRQTEAALMRAVHAGDDQMAVRMLARGTYAGQTGKLNRLLAEASGYKVPHLVCALLSAGADPNNANSGLDTSALLNAASHNPDAVKCLLDKGAHVNTRDFFGFTPLMGAAYSLRPDVVQMLLDRGADVNCEDSNGRTALICAAGVDDIESMQRLLAHGARVGSSTRGSSPLTRAAMVGHTKAVRFLLEHGANAASDEGALFAAAAYGHREVTEILLRHHANANARDIYGKTILAYVLAKHDEKTADLLRKAGAKP